MVLIFFMNTIAKTHVKRLSGVAATCKGACRNFFRGGKRGIHYLLDQSKPYSCKQNFAMEFEPKVKMILFKRCCNSGGMLGNLMQFKCIMDGGLGAKPPVAGQFSRFLEKNNHFNAICITFRTFLKPLKKTKLLRLRIYLKFLNCPAISALFICISNSNQVSTFAYVSMGVARNSQ